MVEEERRRLGRSWEELLGHYRRRSTTEVTKAGP